MRKRAVFILLLVLLFSSPVFAQTTYTVKSGDTIWKIAVKHQVGMSEIIAANPQIKNPNLIFPEQRVCVPRVSAPPGCPPGSTRYTVQPGDSMFTIARRFGVSLDALIRANPQISNPSLIFPGQQLCIPPR